MVIKRTIDLMEVVDATDFDSESIIDFIEREWIRPLEDEKFDDEDVARIHLIRDLKSDFGINDEGIPVILHLIDQVYFLRRKIQRLKKDE